MRHREDLEGRAQLVHALNRAVEQRVVAAVAGGQDGGTVVGVEVGHRGHGHDLAGLGVHQNRCGPLGPHQCHAGLQHTFKRGLHRQIDGQPQRCTFAGGVAQVFVEHRLDPRDPLDLGRTHVLRAVACATQNMAGQGAVGIDPHLALTEQQSRLAQVVHGLLLFGRDVALEPVELRPGREPPGPGVDLHVGKDPGQTLGRLFRIDHQMRLSVKRDGGDVGGQHAALAVGDVCARGHDAGPGQTAGPRLARLGRGDRAHLHPDDGKAAEEAGGGELQAPLGTLARPLGVLARHHGIGRAGARNGRIDRLERVGGDVAGLAGENHGNCSPSSARVGGAIRRGGASAPNRWVITTMSSMSSAKSPRSSHAITGASGGGGGG